MENSLSRTNDAHNRCENMIIRVLSVSDDEEEEDRKFCIEATCEMFYDLLRRRLLKRDDPQGYFAYRINFDVR